MTKKNKKTKHKKKSKSMFLLSFKSQKLSPLSPPPPPIPPPLQLQLDIDSAINSFNILMNKNISNHINNDNLLIDAVSPSPAPPVPSICDNIDITTNKDNIYCFNDDVENIISSSTTTTTTTS
eukprot:413924_1